MEVEDKILVCHHDWMPDGRIVKEPGIITSKTEVQGEPVLGVDIYAGDEDNFVTKQGFAFYPEKNTDKDYYWLEPWDPDFKKKMHAQIEEDIKSGKIMSEADMRKQMQKEVEKGLKDAAKQQRTKRARAKGTRSTGKSTRRTNTGGVRKTH
jgi:hypothetical protein